MSNPTPEQQIVLKTVKQTMLEACGVPKTKIQPNAVFAGVDHPEARGLDGKFSDGGFDTSGGSGRLRGSRPEIIFGSVWCQVCNQPCEFEEGGMHNLFGKPDASGNHRGYILIRAYCHGDEADIALTFQQARENANRSIIAFPAPKDVKLIQVGPLQPPLLMQDPKKE